MISAQLNLQLPGEAHLLYKRGAALLQLRTYAECGLFLDNAPSPPLGVAGFVALLQDHHVLKVSLLIGAMQ